MSTDKEREQYLLDYIILSDYDLPNFSKK